MKAMIKSIQFMGVAVVFLALSACGKSDNNNNVAAVQYGYQNNSCYDITHNTPVATTYCSAVGTNGVNGLYQYSGSQCISTQTQTVVDPTLCANSQYGGYGQQGYGQTGYPYGQTGYGYGSTGYGTTYYPYGQSYANYYGNSGYYPANYGNTYSGSQACVGMYYQYNSYNSYTGQTAQLLQCYPGSCSGQFLMSVQTKTRVLCL